ncbi:hypothetical protein TNCV_1264641 [Trichonephila clavipes]|nr:hypothetical protein TNCV_1264641 [Trichonephila clavipes]
MTPELAPLLTITPHQRENVSALDGFNVHLSPLHGGSSAVLGSNSCPAGHGFVTLTTRLPQRSACSQCFDENFCSSLTFPS